MPMRCTAVVAQKKKSRTEKNRSGISLFYPQKAADARIAKGPAAIRAALPSLEQAGLLTFGSTYRPRLPSLPASGILQLSSPITAAGPSPNSTGFPFQLINERLINNCEHRKKTAEKSSRKMAGARTPAVRLDRKSVG